MNKKYNFLLTALIFFSSPIVFAAQNLDMEKQYRSAERAYDAGYLKDIATRADLRAVQAHKEMLEKRKEAIESSYIPTLLLRIVAYGLSGGSFAGIGMAVVGAVGSYFILGQSETAADVPRLGYFDFLKYKRGQLLSPDVSPGLFDIQGQRGRYTEASIEQFPELQKSTVRMGIIAPPLAAAGLVMAAVSRYFFNKAASYKVEAERLQEMIEKDNAMLKVLGVIQLPE